MSHLPAEERMILIKENIADEMRPEIITHILDEKRDPKIYWGTACTGRPHIGYLVPAVKISQFLAAGCDVTILIADIHAILDNLKTPIELVAHRAKYYEFVIASMLKACGVDITKLRFVLGSSFQLKSDYNMDLLKLSTLVSTRNARKAAAEVVKQSDDPNVAGLQYPLMQALDEQYLDCDIQFGGLDQRKLFAGAGEWLPKIGYAKRAHIMNPMIPGLNGTKMSSSDENSKIDLLDSPKTVDKKIRKADCLPREVEGNGLLALVKHVLLPYSGLKTGSREFKVERRDAEPLVYVDIEHIEEDYRAEVLTPQLLKATVAAGLNQIMSSIINDYNASKDWQEVAVKAYPPPEAKPKKVKNLGTRFPGAKEGEAAQNTEKKVPES